MGIHLPTGSRPLGEVWEDLGLDCTFCVVVTMCDSQHIGFEIGRCANTPEPAEYARSTYFTREAFWGAAVAASLREAHDNPLPHGALACKQPLPAVLLALDLSASQGRPDIMRPLRRPTGFNTPLLLGFIRARLPWGEAVGPLILWQSGQA